VVRLYIAVGRQVLHITKRLFQGKTWELVDAWAWPLATVGMGGGGERRTRDSTACMGHNASGLWGTAEGGRETRDGAAHNQRQGTRWQKIKIGLDR